MIKLIRSSTACTRRAMLLCSRTSRVSASTTDTVTVVGDAIESKEFNVQVEMDQQITIADGYVLHSTTAAPATFTLTATATFPATTPAFSSSSFNHHNHSALRFVA